MCTQFQSAFKGDFRSLKNSSYNCGQDVPRLLSIREANPICPALVKLSPFRIVGLARRQPCCTLTHQKNEIFPACRVEEFPQSKFFVRQGKSADHPDGLTSILTQDCGKFACGNHIVFASLMLKAAGSISAISGSTISRADRDTAMQCPCPR